MGESAADTDSAQTILVLCLRWRGLNFLCMKKQLNVSVRIVCLLKANRYLQVSNAIFDNIGKPN